MSERFANIVVTGANRGLGLEFVRQYAEQAAPTRLVACCREPNAAEALQALAREHEAIEVRALDVLDEASIASLSEIERVDLLINNAGVYGPKPGTLPTASKDWAVVLQTNTAAPLLVTQQLLPALRRAERPVIACLTSKMGSITDNGSGGSYMYRASKAGLNAAMHSLALDLREDEITVLLLHPGWVRTDMGGPQGLLEPAQSVTAMRRIIDGAELELTGRFLDYDGSEIPW